LRRSAEKSSKETHYAGCRVTGGPHCFSDRQENAAIPAIRTAVRWLLMSKMAVFSHSYAVSA
jgi:hypothetical protein